MKILITEEQASFFTKHGHIEFELLPPFAFDHTPAHKRDLFRHNPQLFDFIVKKLGVIALRLTGKKQLRLGYDVWIPGDDLPKKPGKLQELIPIQGLAIAALFSDTAATKKLPLGITPSPTHVSHCLFFNPNLILNWQLTKGNHYIVVFVQPQAVCVSDPYLKQFGYEYGDVLVRHPLITL